MLTAAFAERFTISSGSFSAAPLLPDPGTQSEEATNQCTDCLTPVKQTRCLCVPVVAVRLACPTDMTS